MAECPQTSPNSLFANTASVAALPIVLNQWRHRNWLFSSFCAHRKTSDCALTCTFVKSSACSIRAKETKLPFKIFVNLMQYSIHLSSQITIIFSNLVIWTSQQLHLKWMTSCSLVSNKTNFPSFCPQSHPLSFQLSGPCCGFSLTATLQCRITLLLCLFPEP